MIYRFSILLLVLATFTSMAFVLNAEEGDKNTKEEKKERQFKDRVWIEGQMVAIDAWLEKEHGAKTEATLYSKGRLGFVKKDDGTLWTLVDNTRGHKILTDKNLENKEIKIHGWFYPKTQYVEFWRYQIKKNDKWIDYDYCKFCGFETGDHKDTDFCEDCMDDE